MSLYLLYLIKVSFCLAIFYSIYHLIFRRNLHFLANRFYLLYTSLVSFFIPVFHFPMKRTQVAASQFVQDVIVPINSGAHEFQVMLAAPLERQAPVWQVNLAQIIFGIYLLVVAIMLARFLVKLWQLYMQIKASGRMQRDGRSVLVHPEIPNASFFSFIFLNKYHPPRGKSLILQHELVHARQWHSLDIIIIELLQVVLWFNPLAGIIKRELHLLHEYIADAVVADHHTTRKDYITLLLASTEVRKATFCINHFNSFVKDRITMLYRNRHQKSSYLPYLLIVPAMLGMVVLLSNSLQNADWVNEVKQGIRKIEDKTYVLEAKAPPPPPAQLITEGNDQYLLAWGDHTYPVASKVLDPAKEYVRTVSTSVKINKNQIPEIYDLNIIPTAKGSKIQEVDLQLHFAQFENRDVKTHESQRVLDLPFKCSPEIRHALKSVKDQAQISVSGMIDGNTFIGIGILIEDMDTKEDYMTVDDQKYSAFKSLDARYYPITPYVNKVRPEQLISILTKPTVHLTTNRHDESPSQEYQIMVMDDGTRTMGREQVLEHIQSNGSITTPIVIQVENKQGEAYYAAFDDDDNPTVHYPNWPSYFSEVCKMSNVHATIRTSTTVDWGFLKIEAPAIRKPQPFFYLRGMMSASINGEPYPIGIVSTQNMTIDACKKMLTTRPKYYRDGKLVNRTPTIKLKYVDHLGLPMECDIAFEAEKQETDGDDPIDQIIDRLKPKDFIGIRGFYVDDKLIAPGCHFKITE